MTHNRLRKALQWLLGVLCLGIYLVLVAGVSSPTPAVSMSVVFVLSLVIATLFAMPGDLENLHTETDTFDNSMVTDPVERAKRAYVNRDITEHEFEQRLEDAMEDNDE